MQDPTKQPNSDTAGKPTPSAAGSKDTSSGSGGPGTVDDLDLTVERIETEGVMKEGFSGQEM